MRNTKITTFLIGMGLFWGCSNSQNATSPSPMAESKAIVTVTSNTLIRLGSGINPITERVYNSCVEFDPNNVESVSGTGVDNGNMAYASLDIKQITSMRDLDSFTNASASASFKAFGYSGSFNYDYSSIYNVDSDSIHLGMKAFADYGNYFLKDVKLKPEFQELWETDKQKFYEQCGREFVAGYKLGQELNVLLSSEKKTMSSFESINTSVKASVKKGTVSGNMAASFLNIVSELTKMGTLKISINGRGIKSLKEFSDIMRDPQNIEKVRGILADYVEGMKKEDATKISYITQPYPMDYSSNEWSAFQDYRKETLTDLYSDYRRIYNDLHRVRKITRDPAALFKYIGCAHSDKAQEKCDDYIAKLNKLKSDLQKSADIVLSQFKTCFNAEKTDECRTSDLEVVSRADVAQIGWPGQFRYYLYIQMVRGNL